MSVSAHEEVVRDEAVVREGAAPEVAVAVFDELRGECGADVGRDGARPSRKREGERAADVVAVGDHALAI